MWTFRVCSTKAIGRTSHSDRRRLGLCLSARLSECECQQLQAQDKGWMAHAMLLTHAKLS